MSIADKVIIVTGGTSGIGEGCTRHFAEQEARVVTASIQDEAGEAWSRKLRAGTRCVFTHVRSEDDAALIADTERLHGRIDG